jgi:hypothetical protein
MYLFKKLKLFLVILFFFLSQKYTSQNSSSKENNLKISGSIGATQTFYNAEGIQNRRDPYFWMLNANLNISLFGINVPFSATFSQQNRSFTQPFNQFGISPKNKSITVHLGYRSLMYSNYTLGGKLFLGGGIELNPTKSKVKVSTFFGRFTKAVSKIDTSGQVTGTPAYARWGGGAKVTIGTASNYFDLIALKARDVDGYTLIYDESGNPIRAAENIIGAISTNQKIGKKIAFNGEFAYSAYNTDQFAPELNVLKYSYANNFGSFFRPNSTSQYNSALQFNISYSEKFGQIKFIYRRIDPEYKSMGCVFLNNDLEDLTINLSSRLLKNKINTTISGGIQRNNLNGELANQMKRLIGSLNITYAPTQKLNLSLNASNFNSSTTVRRISGPDSLQYSQVTNTAGINANYSIGNNTKRHNLFLMTNIQQANDNNNKASTFYNANLGYQMNFTPQALGLTSSLTANRNASGPQQGGAAGLNVGLNKQLLSKKLRLNASIAYLINYLDNKTNGSSQIFRINSNYAPNKHHAISGDINVLIRNSSNPLVASFKEYRASLIYTFIF